MELKNERGNGRNGGGSTANAEIGGLYVAVTIEGPAYQR